LGSRFSTIGSIAGATLAIFAASLAGAEGCSSSDSSGLSGNAVDGGSGDATLGPPGIDAGQADGGASLGEDGAFAASDGGAFTGLSCAVKPCALALATGGDHVCALLDDHSVRCWGQNASGELGSGALDGGLVVPSQTPTPTAVAGLSGLTLIAAGGYSRSFGTSCAGAANSGVSCWGSNANGGLGLGLSADGSAPPEQSIAPLPLALDSVVGVSLGGFFGCGLVMDGGVSCWGDNTQNELGRGLDAGEFDPTPTPVPLVGAASAVATGKYHACALLRDHSVECWGATDHGQTGLLVDAGGASPQKVPGLVANALTAGEGSTCAITSMGGVSCWGGNQYGQLGRGNSDASVAAVGIDPVPQPVALPAGLGAVQIASAVGSTCALLSDHSVWCWGDNAYGELGTGSAVPGFSPRPAQVQGLTNIVQIASSPGGWTVCALLQEGSVRCWGSNDSDQLGVDTSGDAGPDESPHPVPVRVLF
jgi:alpha-tubulin suppressor-like RCC1 family protein